MIPKRGFVPRLQGVGYPCADDGKPIVLTLKSNNMDYIIPTKERPVFVAECDYFGFIDGPYKPYVCSNDVSGSTFGVNFKDSVNLLHEWIIENKHVLKEYPKCKFNIYAIDGTLDKNQDKIYKKVYSIAATKAKKYLIV